MLKYKYILQIKYTEAILSNSTRKLSWFEITKMLIAVKKSIYCVIYCNFWHIFVPINTVTTAKALNILGLFNSFDGGLNYRLL